MWSRLLVVCMVGVLVPANALAGAWPRQEGSHFFSFGLGVVGDGDLIFEDPTTELSLYFERGLKRDVTLGLDAMIVGEGDHSAIAFLRFPTLRTAERNVYSYQLGLGVRSKLAGTEGLLQLGASWGRGMSMAMGDGWMALDIQALVFWDDMGVATKADLTMGLKPGKKLKLMMQLQAGDYPGSDPYLRLAPSVAWQVNEKVSLIFGGRVGVIGDDTVGLSFGSWVDF